MIWIIGYIFYSQILEDVVNGELKYEHIKYVGFVFTFILLLSATPVFIYSWVKDKFK